MAKIHILTGGTNAVYTAVVHIAAPVGNNAIGTPWSDAIKNSGRAKTIMTIGNSPGQITQNEANQVLAGTLIEGVMLWQDDPTMNTAQRLADLDARAIQLTDELFARWSIELKYFGASRN